MRRWSIFVFLLRPVVFLVHAAFASEGHAALAEALAKGNLARARTESRKLTGVDSDSILAMLSGAAWAGDTAVFDIILPHLPDSDVGAALTSVDRPELIERLHRRSTSAGLATEVLYRGTSSPFVKKDAATLQAVLEGLLSSTYTTVELQLVRKLIFAGANVAASSKDGAYNESRLKKAKKWQLVRDKQRQTMGMLVGKPFPKAVASIIICYVYSYAPEFQNIAGASDAESAEGLTKAGRFSIE